MEYGRLMFFCDQQLLSSSCLLFSSDEISFSECGSTCSSEIMTNQPCRSGLCSIYVYVVEYLIR